VGALQAQSGQLICLFQTKRPLISSHIFVEASAHLLTVTPTAHWLEYLDLASAILVELHRPVDGTVIAKGPGLGIEWDESAIARFAMERR
jgi:mandelate racemase